MSDITFTIKMLRIENQRLHDESDRKDLIIEELMDKLSEYKYKMEPPIKRVDESSEFAANLIFKKEIPLHEVNLRCAAVNYVKAVGKQQEETLAVDLCVAASEYVTEDNSRKKNSDFRILQLEIDDRTPKDIKVNKKK